MKKLFFLSILLFITGCVPVEEDPFQTQNEILANVDDLVDFQSSSAVAEWTPSMLKKIDLLFDKLLPSLKITGELEGYDPYKATTLIGYYKGAMIYIPLHNPEPDGDQVIVEINNEYYLTIGDQAVIDSIRDLTLKFN